MKFCTKCDTRLVHADSELRCPKCGHTTADDTKSKPKGKAGAPPPSATFKVLDASEVIEDQSTIAKECEKCGNGEAVWWMLQTRSADEPTTQFYRCTKCSYTWRDYS